MAITIMLMMKALPFLEEGGRERWKRGLEGVRGRPSRGCKTLRDVRV